MAIRSYNKLIYMDEKGDSHDTILAENLQGVYIYDLNCKSIASGHINRRVCKCGYVDAPDINDYQKPCPQCGNTSFVMTNNDRYWSRSAAERKIYTEEIWIDSDQTISQRVYIINFAPISNAICIQEARSACATCKKDYGIDHYLNYLIKGYPLVTNDKLLSLIKKWKAADPLFQKALQIDSLSTHYDTDKLREDTELYNIVSLYNMLQLFPFIESLDIEWVMPLRKTLYNKLSSKDSKVYQTFDKVEQELDMPTSMRDLIPMIGCLTNMRCIDELNDDMKSALKYAIMHRHIDKDDLTNLFQRNGSIIQTMNDFGPGFTDFFRRNIVLYNSNIVAAYKNLLETNSHNMKEDTLVRFEKYLSKKKYQTDQIKKFEECFMAGDAIAAMKALV